MCSAGRFARRIRIAFVACAALCAVIGVPRISAAAAVPAIGHGVNASSQSKSILLINGDRLLVTGKSTEVELAGSGFSAAITELRLSGRDYAVPDIALPFLGRGLDLGIFDIAAQSGGATLPLRITYSGRVPRLPGVTITRASAGLAAGYLTAAGAKTFGAALARQFAADHGRASYGTDGLFSGGVWISAASAAARTAPRTPAAPQFPMHTVTVRGITAAGKPDTGDLVYVYDAADNEIYGDPNEEPNTFYHGTARFSLPSGQYWALALFATAGKKGSPAGLRVVLDPRIRVGKNATVTLRARSADSEVTFATPRPTTLLASGVQLAITDPLGNIAAFSFMGGPGLDVWLTPLPVGWRREPWASSLTPG